MRIPEHKINENTQRWMVKIKKWLKCFLIAYFLSIDANKNFGNTTMDTRNHGRIIYLINLNHIILIFLIVYLNIFIK